MQQLGNEDGDAFTEQRRVRHLAEVLVRNLSIPDSLANGLETPPSSRPLFARGAYSLPQAASSVAGPSSAAGDRSERPLYGQRRSKDDLDLHLPTLHRRSTARRKLTISNGAPSQSDGTSKQFDQPATTSARSLDVKGKGRENNLASSREALDSIQESENALSSGNHVSAGPVLDESDLVFGWTSSSRSPTPMQRSKSKSSLKSSSSKRSISSSVSKRLFKHSRRRRRSLIGADDEEDTESDSSGDESPRRGAHSKSERPVSPMSHHVSFQMSSTQMHSLSPSLVGTEGDLHAGAAARRARSASRGSILSIASGSSASTIRPVATMRHSEKEERFLRLKRYQDVRSHLVRSRLVLSIPQIDGDLSVAQKSSARPLITRTRTISLPIRGTPDKNMATSPSSGYSQTPFYVSEPHKKSMEPAFPLDFSVTASQSPSVNAARRSHRLVARIWIEENPSARPDKAGDTQHWKLLLEWEVDLRRLISLGTDPRLFPRHLPANTLIFRMANTDEYLTARLPAFMLADPRDEIEEGVSAIRLQEVGDEIEEGNVSDPGPLSASQSERRAGLDTLSLRRDVNRERERLLARRKMIIDRSVRETRMVQSVDDDELRLLFSKEQELRKLDAEICEARDRIDNLSGAKSFLSQHDHNRRILLLQQLYSDESRVQMDRDASSANGERKRQQQEARRQHLRKAGEVLQAKQSLLEQSRVNHQLDMDVYRSIQLSASQRRATLISELASIFPVDLVDAANVLFSICDIPLPNGDFEAQQHLQKFKGVELDDEQIASALGYVGQAVQLLAAYLTIPLYYPIRCMGSRSLVQDPISQMKGPKIFPLYSRGVDRYRFEYAVFLLNKDIEQIMLEHKIGVIDLTQTLPNLKNIYLTLSSDATLRATRDTGPTYKSGKTSASVQPIILQKESKVSTLSEDVSYAPVVSLGTEVADAPVVNGNIVSRSNGSTASALEKLLGSSWSARPRARSEVPTTPGTSPAAKGRRRQAEASRTMTLLGGRSSLNTTQ